MTARTLSQITLTDEHAERSVGRWQKTNKTVQVAGPATRSRLLRVLPLALLFFLLFLLLLFSLFLLLLPLALLPCPAAAAAGCWATQARHHRRTPLRLRVNNSITYLTTTVITPLTRIIFSQATSPSHYSTLPAFAEHAGQD